MEFMKPYLIWIALLVPAALPAQTPAATDIAVHVASFHIQRVTSESVEAEVDLSVQAGLDARVEQVELSNLHANGVPFFAKPLDEVIDLRKGEDTPLPPLSVVVYFRDLNSLQPLIRIVDDEQARVRAEINMVVRLKPLEQLFIGKSRPLAVVSIDQMVEVEPPGGLLGRTSAIALLHAGQIALDGGGIVGRRVSFDDPTWSPQLAAARRSLLHARSCYSIQQKKMADPVCIDQLAFQGPQQAISTAELLAPWRFDPFLGRAVADHGGHVQPNDPVVSVEPVNVEAVGRGQSLTASYEKVGEAPTAKKIVYPSHSELSLLDRLAPGSYGQLQITPTLGGRGVAIAPRTVREQDHWDDLAVFRLSQDDQGTWRAVVIFLSGKVDGKTIRFSRSVDRSAAGSPILTPQGVIGIVQTESGGTLIAQSGEPH